jgi:SAM-dependent methyltransferase
MVQFADLKARLPHPVRRLARRIKHRQVPVLWGNLRRLQPFSDDWGFDRGLPVDRFYIGGFVRSFETEIRGRVLEVQESAYTKRFGGSRVTSSDVLDIDPGNPKATIVADLVVPSSLPAERFDCIIVTQTLQYVDDPAAAFANLWAALAPGGTLLITVPSVQRVDPDLPEVDRWRFTPRGLEELVRRGCPDGEIEVEGRGNLLSTTAFLMGLSADELRPQELEHRDPRFPLVAAARVRRPT